MKVSIKTEDGHAVEGKGIGRKIMDKLYETYSSELARKSFAYDGEKSFYTVGPLPQNIFEFLVVLEGSSARYVIICIILSFCVLLLGVGVCRYRSILIIFNNYFRYRGGTADGGSPSGSGRKRSKCSHLAKTYKVAITYAAKIPMSSIKLALKASESEQAQDAIRVLDIILRQEQAKRFII